MLPAVHDEAAWAAVVENDAVVRPAAADLLGRLGLGGRPLERFGTGSMPVYAVGDDRVLKLFPTVCAASAAVEAAALGFVHGELPIPTPELLDEGALGDGWRYVLMSRLHGEHLATAWPRIPQADRDRLAHAIGTSLAAMHRLDPAGLAIGPPDWDAFTAEQATTAVERQRAHGLPESWLEQIPDFLAANPPADRGRALLHTEVMREHLLVDPATWALTGLFDFEPAMVGDPAYEFAAVGVFTSRGDTRLLHRITAAYGTPFTPPEILVQSLLHVESNLPWYLRILPAPQEDTLDELAEAWFGSPAR
ncbi:aminoglycoside phosphotransferase family protein [Glycomyces sp. NPDC047369]